jgi:sigma-B regulation protein RsbU (phosphoserine phosphatase)
MSEPFDLLARVPLFHSLPPDELERLAGELHEVSLPAGSALFREGEAGDSLYVILEGRLEIVQAQETPDERTLARRGPGEFVGEMSLLNPEGVRTAAVRAETAARLWQMTSDSFEALIRRHPRLAYDVARVLSARMTAAQQEAIEDLTQKNQQLRQAYRELEAAQAQLVEKERLERELEVAREIQMSVLPRELPGLPGLSFGAQIVPARAVGGDFYDFIPLDERHLGIVVGDVAGKGVPAALFMTQTQALLRATASRGMPPAEALRQVNRQLLSRGGAALFITVLYGVLDGEQGEFVYARAGHELPLLVLPDGETRAMPLGPGQPLGLWPELLLDEQAVTLPPGGGLVLYSDGLTDAHNSAKERLGSERVLARLATLAGQPAGALCEALWRQVVDYRGDEPAYDDVTLVAVSRDPG